MPQDSQSQDKSIKKSDIPLGTSLSKELGINYGDMNLPETSGENFIWGQSIWGIARIGNNRPNVQN